MQMSTSAQCWFVERTCASLVRCSPYHGRSEQQDTGNTTRWQSVALQSKCCGYIWWDIVTVDRTSTYSCSVVTFFQTKFTKFFNFISCIYVLILLALQLCSFAACAHSFHLRLTQTDKMVCERLAALAARVGCNDVTRTPYQQTNEQKPICRICSVKRLSTIRRFPSYNFI